MASTALEGLSKSEMGSKRRRRRGWQAECLLGVGGGARKQAGGIRSAAGRESWRRRQRTGRAIRYRGKKEVLVGDDGGCGTSALSVTLCAYGGGGVALRSFRRRQRQGRQGANQCKQDKLVSLAGARTPDFSNIAGHHDDFDNTSTNPQHPPTCPTGSSRRLATAHWPSCPASVLLDTAARSRGKLYHRQKFEQQLTTPTASPKMTPRSPSTSPRPWATRPACPPLFATWTVPVRSCTRRRSSRLSQSSRPHRYAQKLFPGSIGAFH